MKKLPFGIIPPMTTPFDERGELRIDAVKGQVEFLVKNGADSIAVGGSTGEGHTLEPDELRAIVSEVKAHAPADMPVMASAIVDSTRQAIKMIRAVNDLDVAAVQITPVHYLFCPDDDMVVEHFRQIWDEAGIPLIIYNVIAWSYLSPALAIRVMKEVDGVMGIKQSAGDLKLFADLMIDAPAGKQIYSAVDALMYPSFCMKTPGIIAATPSAIPHGAALLRRSVAEGRHDLALQLHEVILRLWNSMSIFNLPACIKYAQQLQGVDSGFPRMPMRPATLEQEARIKPALAAVLSLVEKNS